MSKSKTPSLQAIKELLGCKCVPRTPFAHEMRAISEDTCVEPISKALGPTPTVVETAPQMNPMRPNVQSVPHELGRTHPRGHESNSQCMTTPRYGALDNAGDAVLRATRPSSSIPHGAAPRCQRSREEGNTCGGTCGCIDEHGESAMWQAPIHRRIHPRSHAKPTILYDNSGASDNLASYERVNLRTTRRPLLRRVTSRLRAPALGKHMCARRSNRLASNSASCEQATRRGIDEKP